MLCALLWGLQSVQLFCPNSILGLSMSMILREIVFKLENSNYFFRGPIFIKSQKLEVGYNSTHNSMWMVGEVSEQKDPELNVKDCESHSFSCLFCQ